MIEQWFRLRISGSSRIPALDYVLHAVLCRHATSTALCLYRTVTRCTATMPQCERSCSNIEQSNGRAIRVSAIEATGSTKENLSARISIRIFSSGSPNERSPLKRLPERPVTRVAKRNIGGVTSVTHQKLLHWPSNRIRRPGMRVHEIALCTRI